MSKNLLLFVIFVCATFLLAGFSLDLFGGDDNIREANAEDYKKTFSFNGTVLNGRFDGNGEIKFEDGSVYTGGFNNGRFDGEGEFSSAEGWQYKGKFAEGQIVNGEFRFDDKIITYTYDSENGDLETLVGTDWFYSGKFGNSGQHGEGRFEFADGSVYFGDFRGGLANGEGAYTSKDGELIYSGGFVNGLFDGQGIYYDEENEISGIWVQGVKQSD